MATSTPVPTTPDGAGEPGHDQESPLDRSRAKATAAQETLAEAGRRVEAVAGQLEQNLAKATADENALGAALDEVDRLKRALKAGQKERKKLVLARKRATADKAKAEDKARKAEAKYDRAVLADLIERQKEHDREGTTAVPVPAGAPAVASDAPPNGQTAPVATEPEDLATATARTTAARTTATDAGEGAQPAPKPPPPSPRRSSPRTRTSRSTSSAASTAASTAKATPEDAPDQA